MPDEDGYHKLSFQIWGRGIHLNAFPDGMYRITPTLKGAWSRANPVQLIFGARTIEPKSASVILKKEDHIGSVEFELVQRPRSLAIILSAAVAGALVGSVLQRGTSNTSR